MITGDHATTAAAIAAELGIEGRALTGTEFAAMTDAELDDQIDSIGVVARVAPEDKVRLVDMLKRKGNVVAMTGDGVNDAPALKRADIGVAMGITGTEVTKEAADMILTDDIRDHRGGSRGRPRHLRQPDEVRARPARDAGRVHPHLRRGGIFDIADGAPLTPLQILWINFAVDVLLGDRAWLRRTRPGADAARAPRRERADSPSPARHSPRRCEPDHGRACSGRGRLGRGALRPRRGHDDGTDDALADAHRRGARGSRADGTIFSRYTIANRRFVQLIGAALALTFLVTELQPLQRIFDTVSLTSAVGHLPAGSDRLRRRGGAGQARRSPHGTANRRWCPPRRRRHRSPRTNAYSITSSSSRARAPPSPTAIPPGPPSRATNGCRRKSSKPRRGQFSPGESRSSRTHRSSSGRATDTHSSSFSRRWTRPARTARSSTS